MSHARPISKSFITYCYQGHSPQSGELLKLPRTHLVECIARGLMQQLGTEQISESHPAIAKSHTQTLPTTVLPASLKVRSYPYRLCQVTPLQDSDRVEFIDSKSLIRRCVRRSEKRRSPHPSQYEKWRV